MGLVVPNPAAIMAIPPDMLVKIPGAQPPPGVLSNFENPPTTVPLILGLSLTFFLLASVCFVIRIWTKAFVVKKWQWDDLTITLGYLCSIVHFVVVFRGCLYGGTGKHQWDVNLARLLSPSSIQQSYISVMVITPALGLIKMSLFIQYYLLFSVRRYIRICVWVGATTFGIYYVAVSVVAFVLNSSWPGETMLETIMSWHYLKFAEFAIPTGVIGMVQDWYLFILPIPAVWSLHLSVRKKLGILLIFATGGLGAVASIISLYYRVKIQNDLTDVTWKVGYVLLWSQIEMFAGVSASSMTAVRQFVGSSKHLKSWGSSLKRSLKGSSARWSSGSQGAMPAHVATMQEWNDPSQKSDRHNEKPTLGTLGLGHDTHILTWDSSSSLKDNGSLSLKSIGSESDR